VVCLQKAEFLDYNVGAGLVGSTWEASVRTKDKMTSAQLAMLTRVNPAVTVGAAFDVQLDKPSQVSGGGARAPDRLRGGEGHRSVATSIG
jgi:hypothetical protein